VQYVIEIPALAQVPAETAAEEKEMQLTKSKRGQPERELKKYRNERKESF